ncbi:MAG: helix-turn-helix domain-containing protein [Candidatus Aminicenantes bacterium]|nr:helix-turn-helix domain-containing protein [Candidatus Aminicenantes bacterium]
MIATVLEASDTNQYMIKAWMIEDGLPQNSISSIHQTRDGYLWLGTPLGLIRFNGITFPINNIWNTPDLKNNRILTLYEDHNARLWIGTDGGGITLLENGKWKSFQANDELSSSRIKKIYQDRSGTIWIGTAKGLNYYKNGKISYFNTSEDSFNLLITAIIEDIKGNLWIGTEKGLFIKRKDQSSSGKRFTPVTSESISAIYSDQSENIWIGTQKGLKKFKDDRITSPFPLESGLSSVPITDIFQDNTGFLWIGSYGKGIFRIKDGKLTNFSTSTGLSDNFIHTITEDRENNIWIGTYTGGIIRMKPRIISTLGIEEGIPENTTTSVLQDHQGFLWIGTRHQGLCKYKNNKMIKIYSTKNGLLANRINTIFQTKNGEIWVGTERGGLNRITDNAIMSYTTNQGLRSTTVKSIYQDHSGILWVGTSEGLNGYINDTFITRDKLNGHSINTLFEDSNNNLWVGSQKGLTQIKHETIRHFNTNGDGSNYEVLAIYESADQPGVLWIGTNGIGLLRLENETFTHYTEKIGLHSNFIFSLTQTRKGKHAYLWMSSFKGIFRVSLNSLNHFFKAESDYITSTFFNESDGMKSSECVGGIQPSIWKTREGTLYIPTIKGLAILNPEEIKKPKHEVPVVIEDIIIDNNSYIHQKNPLIASGKRMFEFYFTALNYSAPRNTQFRYKLEGFEDQWITLDANQKRTALYFNLSPGNYCFQVIACNHLGQWNNKGSRYPFRIQSDFKESLLVYIPRVLILLVFVAGFLLWRLQKKKPTKKIKKYQTSALTPDRAEEIQNKLLTIMEEEKIYLDPDLTLKKLSEKIMVHPNHLSQIVNEKLKQSFNDFINKYRIEEAKEKFVDPVDRKKTILEIAYDVGFYSKSVFNTAFKKFTGMTPSRYRQKIRH